MNTNKIIIFITVVTVFALVTIPTVYKVVEKHNAKLNLVTEKLLIESAQRCYYEGVCKNKKITLKELYEFHYIKDEVINPITKEVYSDKSFIKVNGSNAKFYPLY